MIEIERKYVIHLPDMEIIKKQKNYTCSQITQIYIESESSVTHRVRLREYNDGKKLYTETKKIRIDKMSVIEDEQSINTERFLELKSKIKKGTAPVLKSRHTFEYKGQVFEIDVYPNWKRTCIMETELPDRSTEVEMPEFIQIVSEVTGEKKYSNASMAASFPQELENAKESL